MAGSKHLMARSKQLMVGSTYLSKRLLHKCAHPLDSLYQSFITCVRLLSQCRRLGSTSSVAGAGTRPGSRGGGDVSECKKSLTDIRDRIGSLQVNTYLDYLYNI